MDIIDTIERILDVFELGEEDRERFGEMMLTSAMIVSLKAIPAPDDFEFGKTEDELKESLKNVMEMFNSSGKVRAAISEHFTGVLESMGGSLSEDKLLEIKKILEEFRG